MVWLAAKMLPGSNDNHMNESYGGLLKERRFHLSENRHVSSSPVHTGNGDNLLPNSAWTVWTVDRASEEMAAKCPHQCSAAVTLVYPGPQQLIVTLSVDACLILQ